MITGAGIEGMVDGVVHRIGSPAFVAELAGPLPAAAVAFLAGTPGSATIVTLGGGEGVEAVFVLDDTLREGAREAIESLRDHGLTPLLLSGDRGSVVRMLGDALGIGDARGDQSPAAKLEAVRALQQRGAVVAMVGDGVNDAPALACADVSLSLGTATAIAQSHADVVVLGDDLGRIPEIATHARRTLRILRQNLGWALVYNLIAIPAAALGLVTPLAAAAGMSLSSLAVVANSLRAARIRPGRG